MHVYIVYNIDNIDNIDIYSKFQCMILKSMTSLCVGLVQSSAFCQAARLFALTEDWRPGIEGKLHLSRR